ncbi:MAG: ArsA family ATPase [Promethearchaeota archaeon]
MKLLIFGGKGGVGKSSISSATAVKISQLAPELKVLLISFDVAHNLSDLFNKEVGNELTQITDNLWAIEPDPEKYAAEYTKEFAQKLKLLMKSMPIVNMMPDLEKYIEETFTSKSIPLSLKNSMFFQRLLDAEEVIEGVGEDVNDALTQMKFDVVVADFPPTGNMLALFEIPQNQVQVMLKYTLEIMAQVSEFTKKIRKMTKVFNPFSWGKSEEQRNLSKELFEMLKEVERRGERVTQLMKESGSLRLVSIAEKPSYEEIKRGMELTRPYIRLDAVHVNRIINKKYMECEMCKAQRLNQNKYIKLIKETFNHVKIWVSHRLIEEPIGIDGLIKLANEVYGENITLNEILRPVPNNEEVDDYIF